MQVNAIKNTGFKGLNFEDDSQISSNLLKAVEVSDEFEKKLDSRNIKKPLEVASAVGFATAKTFLTGAGMFLGINSLFKGKPSKFLEKYARRATKFVSGNINELTQNGNKVIKKIGKILQSGDNSFHKLVKKIGASKLEDGTKVFSPKKAFAFLAGATSMASMLPDICKRDNNKNGIYDLCERSQSAYAKNDKRWKQIKESTDFVSEMVKLLS